MNLFSRSKLIPFKALTLSSYSKCFDSRRLIFMAGIRATISTITTPAKTKRVGTKRIFFVLISEIRFG